MKNDIKRGILATTVALFACFCGACAPTPDDTPPSDGDDKEVVDIVDADDVAPTAAFSIDIEAPAPAEGEEAPTIVPADYYTSAVEGSETVYTFTKSATFTLSGNLNGRLVFAESIDDTATIKLNNCWITSEYVAVYWEKDSKKIKIKTVEGTSNRITVKPADNDSSAVKSENNIEVGGSGKLRVIAGQKNGLSGSDIEVGGSGELKIEAKKYGIKSKQVIISGGTTVISDSEIGVYAELNKKGAKGTITMTDGSVTVNSCKKGFFAEVSVTIDNSVNSPMVAINNSEIAAVDSPSVTANGCIKVDGVVYTPPAAAE